MTVLRKKKKKQKHSPVKDISAKKKTHYNLSLSQINSKFQGKQEKKTNDLYEQ